MLALRGPSVYLVLVESVPRLRVYDLFTGLMIFYCFFLNRSLTNGFLNIDLCQFLGGSFFATRLTKYGHVERAELESDKDNQQTSRIFTTFEISTSEMSIFPTEFQ